MKNSFMAIAYWIMETNGQRRFERRMICRIIRRSRKISGLRTRDREFNIFPNDGKFHRYCYTEKSCYIDGMKVF